MTIDNNANPQTQELRSVYTTGLAEIFAQLNISLVVSTYQAGKVILVRHDPGANSNGHGSASALNTHFRTFHKPMGIAVQAHPKIQGRIASAPESGRTQSAPTI